MCAQLLAFATDELSLRVGQTLAGLLNATLVSASWLLPNPVDVFLFIGKCVSKISAQLIMSYPVFFCTQRRTHRISALLLRQ